MDKIMDTAQFSQLLIEIGKMQGTQTAMLQSIEQMHAKTIRLEVEIDRRHDENQKAMFRQHEETQVTLDDHRKEDDVRFNKINRIIWMGAGGLGVLQAIVIVLMLIK